VAESYTEDRKYLYRFHPCNDILKRLYEILEKSKKQDLTPKNFIFSKVLFFKRLIEKLRVGNIEKP